MSRIGKQPITIPEKTDVTVTDNIVIVKGPLGELSKRFTKDYVSIEVKDGSVSVAPVNESLEARSLWGTFASHVANMVRGVNTAFEKKLFIEGIGYRSEVSDKEVVLTVGFSHPVKLSIPEGISVTAEKNVLTVSGADKEKVGQFAAIIRSKKKPEPYKGKGIRYEGEVIKRKQGKRAVT